MMNRLLKIRRRWARELCGHSYCVYKVTLVVAMKDVFTRMCI